MFLVLREEEWEWEVEEDKDEGDQEHDSNVTQSIPRRVYLGAWLASANRSARPAAAPRLNRCQPLPNRQPLPNCSQPQSIKLGLGSEFLIKHFSYKISTFTLQLATQDRTGDLQRVRPTS